MVAGRDGPAGVSARLHVNEALDPGPGPATIQSNVVSYYVLNEMLFQFSTSNK